MTQEDHHKGQTTVPPAGSDSLQQRLQGILDHLDSAVLLLDEDCLLTYWNRPAADLLRLEGKTLIGLSFTACIHPNDREGFSKTVQRVSMETAQDHLEIKFRIKGRQGEEWTYVLAQVRWIGVPDHTSKACLLSLREDRERRRADPFRQRYESLEQQVLEKSRKLADYEAEYQTLMETMNDGLLVLDADHRVVFANHTLADLLGYTIDEMIGADVLIFFDDINRETVSRQLDRRREGELDSYEVEMSRKDQQRITCLIRGAPRYTADGTYAGVVANITDISMRKELEERIRASEREYRNLFEHMQDTVFQTDNEGRLLSINRAGARMLGYERSAEIIGRQVKSFYVHHSDWEMFIKELHERGFVQDYIFYFRRKDGDVVAASANAHIIFDKNGQPLGVEGVSRDVTERVRMERQLKEYARDLERKNEELEGLIYSITHDFKSPLLVIGGLINRLEKMAVQGLGLDKRLNEYLTWIRSSVTKMEKMVNDLLGFYRADKTLAEFERVSLGSLVDTVIRDAEPLAKEKGVYLRKQGRFPVVKGYRNRLYQVFYNLIENAIKYMDQTKDPVVEVGCTARENEQCYYIMDNGPGIPPEHHQKVFQIFYTLAPERLSGTGIGLSIVKKVVESHGGRIWLESDVGKGATFFFTLPGAFEPTAEPEA